MNALRKGFETLQRFSAFLLIGTVIALIWANVGHHSYEAFIEGRLISPETLAAWEASGGLMGTLAMRFAVEVDGELVESDGGWTDGNEVLLNDIDFGDLLTYLYELQGSVDDAAMAELARDLDNGADFPGYRAVAGGETTIRLR